MNNSQPHIINKLRIDLNLPGDQEPYQNNLSEKVKASVLSGISRFDKRFVDITENNILRFERLSVELNLQIDDLDTLERQIEEALLNKIKSAQKRIRRSERQKNEIPERSTPEKRNQTLLTDFLSTGRFPWWRSAEDSLQRIEEQLMLMPQSRLKIEIIPQLRRNPSVLRRLAIQFSEDTIFVLLKRIVSGSDYSEMKSFFDAFQRFVRETKPPVSSGKVHRTERLLFYEALGYAAGTIRNKKELLERWMTLIFDSIPAIGSTGLTGPSTHPWTEWLDSSAERYQNEWLSTVKRMKSERFSVYINTGESISQADELPNQPDITDFMKKRAESAEEYEVPQAGLVLLNPFITRLLDNLGLVEEEIFPNEEKKERAVCLLHYLATGEEQFDEPALALPMLLCGWPVGMPVHRFLPVSEYEKEECKKVLNSALNHWKVLKNTTPDGLRENFLRRNGRLKKSSFGWTLYVEEKTQDILLDQLPWGISAVVFAWMNQHLTVQWRN
ncbi:MAG: hypothetical protein JJU13_02830 [Balneolaceae bacterium]|nr:hypothetical protein [Balneolaceae bacterium]